MTKQELRDLWLKKAYEHRDLLECRAKEGVEKHRKGDCKLTFKDENGKPIVGKTVKINQTSHDFKYGANIFMLDEFESEECNARYREEFKKHFNLATLPFYWDGIEPEEGKPRYDKNSPKVYRRPASDLCMEYCLESGVLPKLHCLVYDKFIPKWLPLDDMAAMEKLYEKRFAEISERYAGKMYEVEVVNELCDEWSWKFKSAISSKRDIIEWAFALARKYFKDDVLVINESNPIKAISERGYRNSYFMMLDAAIAKGVQIDKIGLQHHAFTGASAATDVDYQKALRDVNPYHFNPKSIFEALDKFAEFGKPIEITEITVPTFGETEEDELLQADLLDLIYSCFFGHPAVENVVYWNVPEGYAHVTKENRVWNENNCRGGLFRHDMTPKKSAERMYEMFNKRWHTALELTTDENGCVKFRGFYGDYKAELDGKISSFSIHKNKEL